MPHESKRRLFALRPSIVCTVRQWRTLQTVDRDRTGGKRGHDESWPYGPPIIRPRRSFSRPCRGGHWPPAPRLSSPVPRVHQAQTAARIPRPHPQRAALQARWGEEEGTERSGCRLQSGRRSGVQFLPTRPGVPRARLSVGPQTEGLDTFGGLGPQHKPFSVSSPVLCAQRIGPPEARLPRPNPRTKKRARRRNLRLARFILLDASHGPPPTP